MATLTQHVDTLRAKPHHVRERIAFLAAAGVCAVVAVAWLAALSMSGSLSLKTDDTVAPDANTPALTTSNFSQLLGAAGAALGATSTDPAIKVIDSQTSSSIDSQQQAASATTLSF